MEQLNNVKNEVIPELLVPAGDFDCVRAGVQNGADCIYFGANMFSARASAKNFDLDELEQVIRYCKVRNVKTNLTLNTLLTDAEFDDAINIAKCAYDFGVDAIIVQDLGFAKFLIDHFPGLEVHASTQMSVHNLEGVLELEKLGFSRVVLSREVPINEIEYIRNNCKVDLEMFVHGALCISYSGQCLFSSLVGGRSGNRGKCAQPCRLPYKLLEEHNEKTKVVDDGYLLSPRDLCSLELLPRLVSLGINSFKIEGRMKTPEYVAIVTRIYRKYIDLALSDKDYVVDEADKKDLLQVFNRGGFSTGHLLSEPNQNLIYKEKSNNIGLYLGNISNYNSNKGHITIKLNEPVCIGDSISIEGETGKYTISEIMNRNTTLKTASVGAIVKLGRMKGNIRPGAKVYKLSSKDLFNSCKESFAKGTEIKKIPISCLLKVKRNKPISIKLTANCLPFYNNISVEYKSDVFPEDSISSPISAERLHSQLSKLGNTPFTLSSFQIELDENLHIPSISAINDLRRNAISMLEERAMSDFSKNRIELLNLTTESTAPCSASSRKISLLLENINLKYDYSQLKNVDNVYIPLKYFGNKQFYDVLHKISDKHNLFIYMPTILKPNYKNLLLNVLENVLQEFDIKGFVISNVADFKFLEEYTKKYIFVANYTMNIFNNFTIDELKRLDVGVITPSVELNKDILEMLCSNSSLPVELIAYGRTVLMNSSYCLLGKSNKCYPECDMKCVNGNAYYLKDRLGFTFRVMPDNIQTVTSIYNSKITSIDTSSFAISSIRINVLDETVDEINKIVSIASTGKKLEGSEYTNGNLNKNI